MNTLLKNANLSLAFLLELVALASFAYWGFTVGESTLVKIVLGLGTPVLATVLWGIFAAPNSEKRLRGLAYLIFKVVFFALAIAALALANSPLMALAFAVIFVINTVLLYVWHQ